MAKQISDLYKQGPVKGIVLDLRNDPGGLYAFGGWYFGRVPAAPRACGFDGRSDRGRTPAFCRRPRGLPARPL